MKGLLFTWVVKCFINQWKLERIAEIRHIFRVFSSCDACLCNARQERWIIGPPVWKKWKTRRRCYIDKRNATLNAWNKWKPCDPKQFKHGSRQKSRLEQMKDAKPGCKFSLLHTLNHTAIKLFSSHNSKMKQNAIQGKTSFPCEPTLSHQEWSISNFPCSLARNVTSHIMKNFAFHSLLRWKMIILTILTTPRIH